MKPMFNPLRPDEMVSASVRNLPPVPKGTSVYKLDTVRSGVPFRGNEWELMFEHSHEALKEVVLVNHQSGQRLLVSFASLTPVLQEVFFTDPLPVKEVIFYIDKNQKLVHAEFGPNQFQPSEVFVNMGYGILFRMDYFLNNEQAVIATFLENNLGALPKDESQLAQTTADYHQIAKRVRALMGIEIPTIYNDYPNQTVTGVPLEK